MPGCLALRGARAVLTVRRASGAEIAALEAFQADPSLSMVRASTFEFYGRTEAPPNATVYFNGIDDGVGQILKYTVTEPA